MSLQLRPVPAIQVGRWPGVDAARGLAIVLMVLDHLLIAVLFALRGRIPVELSGWMVLVRYTVTRASLPLFMLASGAVLGFRGLRVERWAHVAVAAGAVNFALYLHPIGIGFPEVLFVWCLVMAGACWIRRYPVAVGAVGVVQVYCWHISWDGYQPGVLAVCVALGVLAGPACLEWADRLPGWLRSVGRRPLGWYCGHLLALGVLVSILT